MKWVTWENIGIDRMGCGWLIKRYIDPDAEFSFIPINHRPLPAGAEPFDIPGERYSHHQGHCTFHTLLHAFNMTDRVLRRIARIIDEADAIQEVSLEPTATGLDVICRGIRLTSADDYVALERGMMIYDALYAQLSREP